MTRRTTVVCLLALAAIFPAAARAEHTRYWRQSDFSDFEKGTAKGVAISSDGRLAPAPKFSSFADPSLAYVWALLLDSRGRLYAAGGSDAKVLRFDSSGKGSTVFESSELAAQAIAFDANDNLYVGTSPDGKVYRVTPEGTKSVYFDPHSKYIWALAEDPQGNLFVGTGDKGEVFVVAPNGKGRLFYQSQELHARTLAFDAKGNLLVGTDPSGLILRIEINRKTSDGMPQAGTSFVIYETAKKEVTSLATDSNGNLYAASIGGKTSAATMPALLPAMLPQAILATTITAQGNVTSTGLPAQAQQALPIYPYPAAMLAGGAEVVKIAPDGSPTTVWSSTAELVFSLAISPAGRVLLGTGNTGTLLELKDHGVYASLAKTASAQITSMVAGSGGEVFVATANPGKIFSLGPEYESSGTFTSEPFDAKIFSHWGRLAWWGENGATHGKTAFYLRCGNTSNPDKDWSPWAGPYKDATGDPTTCPASRFAQWKVAFLDAGKDNAPSISWVRLAYLPKNVAPVVDDIALQDPGVRIAGYAAQAAAMEGAQPVQLRIPHATGFVPSAPPSNEEARPSTSKIEIPPQGFAKKGYQSVLWTAHDANGDNLIFTAYYRAEDEQSWHVLKDKLTERYYSWDTTSMPDGAYYLKIVASDSPSNPPDQALWGERVSDRWEVANTPPRIENLRAGAGLLNSRASFDAISASGPIALAKYSIDSGDWQIIFPVGNLSDASKESYYIEIPGLPSGDHTLAVQVWDRFDNTATAKVTFAVRGRGSQP